MATELKPCPFCGNNAKLKQFTSGCLKKTKVFYVECYVCRNQTKVELDKEQAIEAWNRRVGDVV